MNKILNLIIIILCAITVVILGMFMFGGNLPNQQYVTPVYTSTLLNWAYILFGIAIVAAVVFPIARLFSRPKDAMKSFIGLVAIAILILIAYSLADGTPLKLVGYHGPDNVPSRLIFSDTILYTMYFLFALALLAIAGTEIYKRIR